MNVLTSGPGPAPVCLLLCLSHLRWDLVFQRPQHLLTRAARDFDVVLDHLFDHEVEPLLGERWVEVSVNGERAQAFNLSRFASRVARRQVVFGL